MLNIALSRWHGRARNTSEGKGEKKRKEKRRRGKRRKKKEKGGEKEKKEKKYLALLGRYTRPHLYVEFFAKHRIQRSHRAIVSEEKVSICPQRVEDARKLYGDVTRSDHGHPLRLLLELEEAVAGRVGTGGRWLGNQGSNAKYQALNSKHQISRIKF